MVCWLACGGEVRLTSVALVAESCTCTRANVWRYTAPSILRELRDLVLKALSHNVDLIVTHELVIRQAASQQL